MSQRSLEVDNLAFVFSGQGAQYPGMGKDIYDAFPAAGKVLDDLDKRRSGLKELIFSSSEETLMQTANTQCAMYALEAMITAVLEEGGIKPSCTAGFSLGELTALAAAGVYSMEDGFGITRIRAALMQEATEKTDAVMDAVLKLQDATVEKLAAQYRSIYPVNYNSPGQVVVAAARNEVEAFEESVRASGGRTMRLRVSGGFHSPFMSTAADRFLEQLDAFSFSDPSIPVWSNVSGRKYEGNIKAALALQIKSPVRWVDIVEDMIRCGVTCFIEIGPGSTLTGLIRRISRNVKTYNAGTVEGVNRILEEVRNV